MQCIQPQATGMEIAVAEQNEFAGIRLRLCRVCMLTQRLDAAIHTYDCVMCVCVVCVCACSTIARVIGTSLRYRLVYAEGDFALTYIVHSICTTYIYTYIWYDDTRCCAVLYRVYCAMCCMPYSWFRGVRPFASLCLHAFQFHSFSLIQFVASNGSLVNRPFRFLILRTQLFPTPATT